MLILSERVRKHLLKKTLDSNFCFMIPFKHARHEFDELTEYPWAL